MSIKTALLAVTLGLAAAGAAQAQSVVNISVHANPPRVAAPPVRVVHSPAAVRVQAPLPAPVRVQAHGRAQGPAFHRAPPPLAQVNHVPPRHAAGQAHRPLPPPHVQHRAPVRWQVGQQLSRSQLQQARDLDWRRAGLRAPQRGQQWVSLNGFRLLVSMSSDRVLRVG